MLILSMQADKIIAAFDAIAAEKRQLFEEKKQDLFTQKIHPCNEKSQLTERKIRFLKLQFKVLLHDLLYSDKSYLYWNQLYHARITIMSGKLKSYTDCAITEFNKEENSIIVKDALADETMFLDVQALYNLTSKITEKEELAYTDTNGIQTQLKICKEKLLPRIQIYENLQSKEDLEADEKEEQRKIIEQTQAEIIQLKLIIDILQAQYKVAITKESTPDWDSIYNTKLKELSADFVSAYKTLLDAREAIFVQGEEVHLDDNMRHELLEKYARSVEEKEMPHYQNFKIPVKDNDKTTLLNAIATEISQQNRLCEAIKSEQENAGMELAENQEVLLAELNELESEYQQRLSKHYSTLHCLCLRGHTEAVKKYLQESTDEINQLNCDGLSALHIACLRGDTAIANLLIEAGANVLQEDEQGYYPLHYLVAKIKDEEKLKNMLELLKHEDLSTVLGSFQRSALHAAARYGNTPAITVLLEQPTIDPKQADNHAQRTALHLAAAYGHADAVDCLLTHNVKLAEQTNSLNETALYEAIHAGHKHVAAVFAKHQCCLHEEEIKRLKEYAASNEKINWALQAAINQDNQTSFAVFFYKPPVHEGNTTVEEPKSPNSLTTKKRYTMMN